MLNLHHLLYPVDGAAVNTQMLFFLLAFYLPSKTDHQEKIGLIMKTNNEHIIVAIYRGITRISKGEIYKPYNNVPLQIYKKVHFHLTCAYRSALLYLFFITREIRLCFMLMSGSSYSYIFIMNKKRAIICMLLLKCNTTDLGNGLILLQGDLQV